MVLHMSELIHKSATFASLDEGKHETLSIATCQREDRDGEVCHYETQKPLYVAWSNEALESTRAAGQSESLGNMRWQHSLEIAGKVVGLEFNDDKKEIRIRTQPIPEKWDLIRDGFVTGTSQAGSYAKRWCPQCDADIPKSKGNICPACQKTVAPFYAINLVENSYVDMPCLPAAHFLYVKANGSLEMRKFKNTSLEPSAEKHSYGTAQIEIEPEGEIGTAIKLLRDSVDYADLNHAAGGRGEHSHVTVRYGITVDDTKAIAEYLAGQAQFTITFGKVESFEPTVHSDGASPLIVRAHSDELVRINSEIKDHGEWKDSDFNYTPHCTLAYVAAGSATKYVGSELMVGKTYTVKVISIRSKEGEATHVQLREPASKAAQTMKNQEATKTAAKTVRKAGEELTANCFLLVGDKDQPTTWALPCKFASEAKTTRHLQVALLGLDRVDGISQDQKTTARKKLLRLCKAHGIEINSPAKSATRSSVPLALISKMIQAKMAPAKAAAVRARKGMFEVGWFANIIGDVASLLWNARYETEFEGDESSLPEDLRQNLADLIETFLAMAEEETSELHEFVAA
jgi:2'-5' RNA ligase